MNISDATILLDSFLVPAGKFRREVGVRNGGAFLLLSDPGSGEFAVVTTPGDRWYSLEVDGGFSWDRFEEGATDDEVSLILEKLVLGAVAYLEGRVSTSVSRVFRLPSLRVETDAGPLELHLSLPASVKRLLRIK